MEPIKHPIRVFIDPNPVPPMPVAIQAALANFMACYNCRGIMQRGTQCPNCGSWCR